ncbi:MAG: hypothetical protein Q8900_06915 [Bacillota bacterium]|nr:hypothetical protein [Bacillota bacterium]
MFCISNKMEVVIINSKKIKALIIFSASLFMFNGCSFVKSENVSSGNTSSNSSSSVTKSGAGSGLLLGLVKEPDLQNKSKNNTDFENKSLEEYRTLWIYKDKNDVSSIEKKGGIITPYGDKFVMVTNNSVVTSTAADQPNQYSDNFYSKYSSYFNFSVIISQNLNSSKKVLTEDSMKSNYLSTDQIGFPFVSRTETIQYVGNKYALVKTSQYATGGGTLRSGFDDIKFYDINNLTAVGYKRPNMNVKSMLGSDASRQISSLSDKYNKSQTDDNNNFISEKFEIDDDNLTLKRSKGKWIVQAPLYENYIHQGNGSSFNNIDTLYDTDIKVPEAVTGYDTLSVSWDIIKSKYPDAKDAVSSPNKDMLAVLTSSNLMIFLNPEKGIDNPSKTIPVDKNEKIVLNQWAAGDYIDKWSKALGSNQ